MTSATISTTLSAIDRIRTKARRLTASPSENQLTTSALDDYINTFYMFDLPEQLRMFNTRSTYDFYTEPNVDVYNFPRNQYINIYQPVYIAGYQSFYTQSREQFFRIYPQLEFQETVATGNGAQNSFTFTLSNVPVLRGYSFPPSQIVHSQVFFTSVDLNGNRVIARDDGSGGFIDENNAALPAAASINYATGAVTTLSFTAAPGNNQNIIAQYVSYTASRPEAMLFFDDVLILRPVPDIAYKVTFEVEIQPLAFTATDNASANNPLLDELWQLIAYGAAKKILEDRQDTTSLANIMPSYLEQMRLCLRRTTQQLAQERAASIYTEQVQYPFGNFFNRF